MADNLSVSGPGARKAAAILLGLGSEVASELFKMLGESEVRRIAIGARELRKGAQEDVPEALREFVEAMERVGGDAAAGENVLREAAERGLGAELTNRAFDGLAAIQPPDEILGPISQADADSLAMVLSREQPQTVALLLSSIERPLALAVMERLPADQRPAVLRRMATIESVAPEVLAEVGQALSGELRAVISGGMRKVDGRATTLEILRRSTGEEQTAVLAEIERVDQVLAADLRAKLFTFDDILLLTDRDLQTLIKELDTARLMPALKGASAEMKQKFMRNMSSRAGQALEDDLAAMSGVKLSVVEKAQAEIAKIALTLAETERITLVRPTDRLL